MAATTSYDGPNSDSALLSLPAELRNRIYEYVLVVQNSKLKVDMQRQPSFWRGTDSHSVLALLQTCRQIHKEARGIFYYENTLCLTSTTLPSFVASLDLARRTHLRSLQLDLTGAHFHGNGHAYDGDCLRAVGLLTGLRSVHLIFSNSSIHQKFFEFVGPGLSNQSYQFPEITRSSTLRRGLEQLQGLTELEFSLVEASIEVDKKYYGGAHQKGMMAANKTIREIVLKQSKDAEPTSGARATEE